MGGGFFNDKLHNISHDHGEKDIHTISARLRARSIKIVPEFSYKLPDQFKQADKLHLNVAGHQKLAKMLLPGVMTALNQEWRDRHVALDPRAGRSAPRSSGEQGSAGFQPVVCSFWVRILKSDSITVRTAVLR
jgi:hypothetical protein